MSEIQKVKIISCFNITGRGLIAEIQHNLNGLPPNSILKDSNSDNFWIVKQRVHASSLEMNNKEVYFECETEFTHINQGYRNDERFLEFINNEEEKRKNGIYWYFLTPNIKDNKPSIGQELLIE